MRIRQRRGSVSVFGSMHTNGLLSLVAVLSNVRGRKVDLNDIVSFCNDSESRRSGGQQDDESDEQDEARGSSRNFFGIAHPIHVQYTTVFTPISASRYVVKTAQMR